MKRFSSCLLIGALFCLSQTAQAGNDNFSEYLEQADVETLIDIAVAIDPVPIDECLVFIRACRAEARTSCGSLGVKSVRAVCDTGECSWECNALVLPQN